MTAQTIQAILCLRRFQLFLLVALCVVVVGVNVSRAHAATISADTPRRALVIGNGAYPFGALTNPVNDARAMSRTLTGLGWRVTNLENASYAAMDRAIRQFGDSLRDGSIGLFYYAGHGVQVKGRNFLIPIDASIEREDEVAYKSIDAAMVLAKLESAGNPMNLIILDACRNNPFARAGRAVSTGLAPMDAPVGSFIAFATAPGSQASDGNGENGTYTRYLLENMVTPGLKVEDVFKRVRASVRQETDGQQIPWENTSLEGDFYFVPPSSTGSEAATAQPAPPPPPAQSSAPAPAAAPSGRNDSAQPKSPRVSSYAERAKCFHILQRASLGEVLTEEEEQILRSECK